jgi:hypothetical protein
MTNDHSKLEVHMNRAIKILIVFIVACLGSSFLAGLMALLNFHDRKMPYETWFYWDYKHNDVLYFILTIHQYFAAAYISVIDGGVDGIPMIFMSFIAGIIDELSEEIISIENEKDEKEAHKKLCHCVELHLKSNISARKLQTIFYFRSLCKLS